ncbi:hypothetical protein UFOVP1590_37 [uncultured Caudovirales phage]|uniref:Uncharacterized protein n=1 Tax=uncultured Caudovirales phage TaxID=2100421 RepID=A0A6J5SS09_9CAUD|nr:hypothetical protein UFOVP1590_37 [uncultured Caudovirales phage]
MSLLALAYDLIKDLPNESERDTAIAQIRILLNEAK